MMKFLAKRFGQRIVECNEWCYIEAYYWRGRLYYTRFEELR
jgi:hypothetical protein